MAKLLLEVEGEEPALDVEHLAAVPLADHLIDVVDRLEEVQLAAVAEGEISTSVAPCQAHQRRQDGRRQKVNLPRLHLDLPTSFQSPFCFVSINLEVFLRFWIKD